MIALLVVLAAGYALGSFIERARLAYLLCLPVSPAVYVLVTLLFTALGSQGMTMPPMPVFIIATLIQVPLMMLGVFLARRKAARNGYKV
jgi:hypothetical protein